MTLEKRYPLILIMKILRESLQTKLIFERDVNKKYIKKQMMCEKEFKKYQPKNYRKLNILISKANQQNSLTKRYRLNMYNKHLISGKSKSHKKPNKIDNKYIN